MSKYNYTPTEQKINNVLKYQDEELKKIKSMRHNSQELEKRIKESEELLQRLGYTHPSIKNDTHSSNQSKRQQKKLLVVPSWDNLSAEAEVVVGIDNVLEDLFTDEELRANELAIKRLNWEYNALHKLDKYDIAICVSAGLLAAVVDILLIGIPQKTKDGLKGAPLANYVRNYFDKKYPEEEVNHLANSRISKVPYDAQDNRNTTIRVEGLSAYYHRLLSLGHDPLLGFIFGVADILNGRMTTIDKAGNIISQEMPNYVDRKESTLFAAIAKQLMHLKSDLTTSMGLPVPLMGLFNLLQFGSIGEEEQTIAEIVQGMYYEGYDFVHFCTLSIPVMITEVVIRIAYGIKRIKEGYSVRESIPFSTNHSKHPKLGTMLFIGHASATAINVGKVYFSKNPMAINYPQWIAFAKYSYKHMKWVMFKKPIVKEAYVRGVLHEELDKVFESVDVAFESFSKDYIVIFE